MTQSTPLFSSQRRSNPLVALNPRNIVLAGEFAIRKLASERPGARLMHFASPALRQFASELGLHLTHDDADVVLVGGMLYKEETMSERIHSINC